MVRTCCITGCSSRSNREKDCGFYNIPAIIKHQGEQMLHLSTRRRTLWLKAIDREIVTNGLVKHAFVCTNHFVKGMPSISQNVLDVDWVPTKNLDMEPIHETRCQGKRIKPDALQIEGKDNKKLKVDSSNTLMTAEIIKPSSLKKARSSDIDMDYVKRLERANASMKTSLKRIKSQQPIEIRSRAVNTTINMDYLTRLERENAFLKEQNPEKGNTLGLQSYILSSSFETKHSTTSVSVNTDVNMDFMKRLEGENTTVIEQNSQKHQTMDYIRSLQTEIAFLKEQNSGLKEQLENALGMPIVSPATPSELVSDGEAVYY